MILPTDQQDTFLLVIRDHGFHELLERTDIVAGFWLDDRRGFDWKYLRHETWERPTLTSRWSKSGTYQVEGLSSFLREKIQTHLREEVAKEFLVGEEDRSNRERPPAKPTAPLTEENIDRRRFWSILIAYRVSRMADPHSIQDCVLALKKKTGIPSGRLATILECSPSYITHLEHGERSLSSTKAEQLADIADELMEWKIARFLRSHALVQRHKSYERGGPR